MTDHKPIETVDETDVAQNKATVVDPADVALMDLLHVAGKRLMEAAKSTDANFEVPHVIANGLTGSQPVLLMRWRAWDIYAVPKGKKWIIRADMVR